MQCSGVVGVGSWGAKGCERDSGMKFIVWFWWRMSWEEEEQLDESSFSLFLLPAMKMKRVS